MAEKGKLTFEQSMKRLEEIVRQLEQGETPAKQTFVDEVAFDRETLTDEVIRGREY